MRKSKEKKSFWKGWRQVINTPKQDKIRDEIMEGLDVQHKATFSNRLTGKYGNSPAECMFIAGVFAKHGITDIWGD